MNGPTMRALRETVGMSVRVLADIAHVREQSIRRWETGINPIPDEIAQIVSDAKARQDEVVAFALAKYEALYDDAPEGTELTVELRYWCSEGDYLERSTDAALGADGDWLMANATTRRCAAVLEDIGVSVTYSDGTLPRPTTTPTLRLV